MKHTIKILCTLILLSLILSSCNMNDNNYRDTTENSESTTQEIIDTTIQDANIIFPDSEKTYEELEPIQLDSDGDYPIILYFTPSGEYYSPEGIDAQHPGRVGLVTREYVDEQIPYLRVGNAIFENVSYCVIESNMLGDVYDIYRTSDKSINIKISRDNEECYIYPNFGKDTALKRFDGDAITEDTLSAFALYYIESVLGEVDSNEYSYFMSTHTHLIERKEGSSSVHKKNKEGFYVPQGEEKVSSYRIGFAKYVNGVITDDVICVTLDSNGNIKELKLKKHNVDWSACDIDFEKAESQARYFLENNISDGYELISYNLLSHGIQRIYSKESFYFSADVKLKEETEGYTREITVHIFLG